MSHSNRRTFLKTAAAVGLAGAGALNPRNATAAEKQRKFTMALVGGSIGVKVDLREAIRLAGRYGFESVAPPRDLTELSEDRTAGVLAELEANHLVWAAASLPVDFRRDREKFERGLAELPKQADVLQRVGVTRVGTWLMPCHGSLTYLANFRQHVARLREVAKVLGDRGLRFGLEYVGPKTSWTRQRYAFVHTMVEAQELIAEIGQDNVGLVLDSWHWYTAGETAADLLTLTNDQVVACDLNDAPAGIALDEQEDMRRELPSATGVIDVRAFLEALVSIGYDGPIRAEPFNQALRDMADEEAVAATAAAMKKAFALVE